MKLLLCDGDSWTAGDIVDPNLFGNDLAEVHHPDNNQYIFYTGDINEILH